MNITALGNSPLYVNDKILTGKNDAAGQNSSVERSFGQILDQTLEEVNSSQISADQLTESFLTGGPVEIHQMLIAMEKADLALRQTVEIRNKLVEAYKTIANMQI